MKVSEVDEMYLANYLKIDEPDDDDIRLMKSCSMQREALFEGRQVCRMKELICMTI